MTPFQARVAYIRQLRERYGPQRAAIIDCGIRCVQLSKQYAQGVVLR